MKFRRPRSLNGLILVGFGVVALPLLVAVVWALVSLDRVAKQSEQLMITGVSAAEGNRRVEQALSSLERVARQYQVLGSADSLQILSQDLAALEAAMIEVAPLVERAGAEALFADIRDDARTLVSAVIAGGPGDAGLAAEIAKFAPLRQRADNVAGILTEFVDTELARLQENARTARRYSSWQVAALVPGTLFLVIVFALLVSRPIRQIDAAIQQLGASGFSKPISVDGPADLERLGRQLEWLRVRLLELAQEKNKFLRHMSHELKTPLANIREGTELLLDGSVGELDSSQREVTDILRMNGLKLQQLIENLLSFSAWQTRSEDLILTDFSLSDHLIAVAKSQRLALKAAGIQLKLQVADITVNADQDKLRTVFDNLMSNAIKFTPRGGIITVRAARLPDAVVVECADTGPGIPADEEAHIFDAFFQGRGQQSGQVGGTGIGLSVVRECIQAHDGAVEIVHSDEFSGAHFRITIPQSQQVKQQPLVANA